MNFENERYDIVIIAGQSNAQGCGRGPADEEYKPDADIMHLYQRFTLVDKIIDGIWKMTISVDDPTYYIDVADEIADKDGRCADLGLSFCKLYKERGLLAKGRKILLVRAAVGGTGFMKKQWGLGNELYLRMIDMIDHALSLNNENRIVAFLWHQGEHDAFEGNPPETFESQLEAMINDVRARYNLPSLPFVSGDFVNDWKMKNIEICEPIVEKIKAVSARLRGAFVETADLLSNDQKNGNGDDIHFCREAQYILGKRYFEAYKSIIEKN